VGSCGRIPNNNLLPSHGEGRSKRQIPFYYYFFSLRKKGGDKESSLTKHLMCCPKGEKKGKRRKLSYISISPSEEKKKKKREKEKGPLENPLPSPQKKRKRKNDKEVIYSNLTSPHGKREAYRAIKTQKRKGHNEVSLFHPPSHPMKKKKRKKLKKERTFLLSSTGDAHPRKKKGRWRERIGGRKRAMHSILLANKGSTTPKREGRATRKAFAKRKRFSVLTWKEERSPFLYPLRDKELIKAPPRKNSINPPRPVYVRKHIHGKKRKAEAP